MNEPGGAEKFEISCDCVGAKARIAMVGSAGTEIFIMLPFPGGPEIPDAELENRIVMEAEARLRTALLSLLARTWPPDEA